MGIFNRHEKSEVEKLLEREIASIESFLPGLYRSYNDAANAAKRMKTEIDEYQGKLVKLKADLERLRV